MLVPYSLFKDMVSAVALGSSEWVIKAIEPMHGTMGKNERSSKSGNVELKKIRTRLLHL